GPAASEKLTALAWNRDPRQIRTQWRGGAGGARNARGREPGAARGIVPPLLPPPPPGAQPRRGQTPPRRTGAGARRCPAPRSITRSTTLDAPIAATVSLAEIAEELVHKALAHHPDEKIISLLAISVSQLEKHTDLQLELPLALHDDTRRPGSKSGVARWLADRAVDAIRDRFGWEAVGYGSVAFGLSRSVPDAVRELAAKDL